VFRSAQIILVYCVIFIVFLHMFSKIVKKYNNNLRRNEANKKHEFMCGVS